MESLWKFHDLWILIFANLQAQYQRYKDDIDAKIQAVLNKSNYIMGEEIYELENALEDFH